MAQKKQENRTYYMAYDDRYRQIHGCGLFWVDKQPTPKVLEVIRRMRLTPEQPILEIGCGEGRDAAAVLAAGYRLLATDVSPEAVAYCRSRYPAFADRFQVLDCVAGRHEGRYDLIYAVAVLHMLVEDEDRRRFYAFVRDHLTDQGRALICTMGDGTAEYRSDPETAFTLQKRIHGGTGREVSVAGTTCRMISFDTFRRELADSRLQTEEMGLTAAEPDFNSLLYAVVGRA